MSEYDFVELDKARKIYIPASKEEYFKGKKFVILKMPDGDVIFHPIKTSKTPLADFQKSMGVIKKDLKTVKKEILETASKDL